MDRTELVVERYLSQLGLGSVIFEPDGNVPPDFAVDGRIAVEARRLNQNHVSGDSHEGLEVAEAKLYRFISALLPTYGAPTGGQSYWVAYHFRRPFAWKRLKRDIKAALDAFVAAPQPQAKFDLSYGAEVEMNAAGIPLGGLLELGAYGDRDSGGFIAAEIIRNLHLCIAEKSQKVAAHRARYPVWWLILPDHIGAWLNADERAQIPGHVNKGIWDRIVLLDPGGVRPALEI